MIVTMVILSLIGLGLCLGSFVNALVWRLHEQSQTKSRKRQKELSIVNGRSKCVHCGHGLAPKDLIPLISWLQLRGNCRYCGKAISSQYPLVELSTAILFALSYIFWPPFSDSVLKPEEVIGFGVWLVSLTGFMALIVYDLRWMLLPNKIIFPLLWLAGSSVGAQAFFESSFQPLISSIWGTLIGGGLFYALFQISSGRWIGGGDVKLGFLLGILLGGPEMAFLMIFLASLLGSLYSVPLLAKGKLKAKARLPFGPFLIISAIITKLFGQQLIDWYATSFLI